MGPANPRSADPDDFKRLDVEYHRHAAAGYDDAVTRHFSVYHRHAFDPWVRELVADVPDPLALDVGTGTGVAACRMAALGCRVKAVDHSIDMLARATARATAAGVKGRVDFVTGDAERLGYPARTFHAVSIQGVLHHLADPAAAVAEAMRVLRPGGRLFISEPCVERAVLGRLAHAALRPGRWVADLLKGRPAPEPDVSDHERPLSGPALVSMVRSLGFQTRQEFLVNFGAVRFLPRPLRIYAILALSLPTRRTHGDLIFLKARKPS